MGKVCNIIFQAFNDFRSASCYGDLLCDCVGDATEDLMPIKILRVRNSIDGGDITSYERWLHTALVTIVVATVVTMERRREDGAVSVVFKSSLNVVFCLFTWFTGIIRVEARNEPAENRHNPTMGVAVVGFGSCKRVRIGGEVCGFDVTAEMV